MKSIYLVIAHGSRNAESNQAFFEFLDKFRKAYPKREVCGAFLEIAKPSIPEALHEVITKGAQEIFIIPLMFFPGRHVKEDIPAMIQEAREQHPDVDFHYGGPLGDHPMLATLLDDKAKQMKGKS